MVLLYEEYFPLGNIETDFKAVSDQFYGSEAHRTCKKCGNVLAAPK